MAITNVLRTHSYLRKLTDELIKMFGFSWRAELCFLTHGHTQFGERNANSLCLLLPEFYFPKLQMRAMLSISNITVFYSSNVEKIIRQKMEQAKDHAHQEIKVVTDKTNSYENGYW